MPRVRVSRQKRKYGGMDLPIALDLASDTSSDGSVVYLTSGDAAEFAGVSQVTLSKAAENGQISFKAVIWKNMPVSVFRESDVEQFRKEYGVKAKRRVERLLEKVEASQKVREARLSR